MKKYFLFDLDGTLTDSGPGILNSVKYALAKYQIHVSDLKQLLPFVGPPLIDSFKKYYGFTQAQAEQGVQFYREYYCERGIFENTLYDGIAALVHQLKNAGGHLILATSKPEPFAEQILRFFGLENDFDQICGATMDEGRTEKSEVIAYALEKCAITDRSQAVMIGDRSYDILGAAALGMDAVGVTYGYGSRTELENANPMAIADTVAHLQSLLLALLSQKLS